MDDGTELIEAYGQCPISLRPLAPRPPQLGLTSRPTLDFLLKFIIIGEAGSGKSCLLHHFIQNTCSSDLRLAADLSRGHARSGSSLFETGDSDNRAHDTLLSLGGIQRTEKSMCFVAPPAFSCAAISIPLPLSPSHVMRRPST
jgi:hypothetical protein